MKPSEARTQLLRQHDWLREIMAAVVALGERLLQGEAITDDLLHALTELREALAEHNRDEQAMLENELRDADAWGPVRVARMLEEHRAEHEAMRELLAGTESEVAHRLADFSEQFEAHMAAEERTFLSSAVLRDDIINPDPSD
jgi:ribosomal 50S subunit-associated protein YjgA (DUF615 family)